MVWIDNFIYMFGAMIFLAAVVMLIWGINWTWHSEKNEKAKKRFGAVIFAVSLLLCARMMYLFISNII